MLYHPEITSLLQYKEISRSSTRPRIDYRLD
jgi:hypothetical protein